MWLFVSILFRRLHNVENNPPNTQVIPISSVVVFVPFPWNPLQSPSSISMTEFESIGGFNVLLEIYMVCYRQRGQWLCLFVGDFQSSFGFGVLGHLANINTLYLLIFSLYCQVDLQLLEVDVAIQLNCILKKK